MVAVVVDAIVVPGSLLRRDSVSRANRLIALGDKRERREVGVLAQGWAGAGAGAGAVGLTLSGASSGVSLMEVLSVVETRRKRSGLTGIHLVKESVWRKLKSVVCGVHSAGARVVQGLTGWLAVGQVLVMGN